MVGSWHVVQASIKSKRAMADLSGMRQYLRQGAFFYYTCLGTLQGHLVFQQRTRVMIPMSYSMEHLKLWIGTNMTFVDAASVVLFGTFCNKFLYPYLEKRSICLSRIRKVTIGSSFYVLAYLSMIGIDHRMRRVYEETGEEINIGWQFFPTSPAPPELSFLFLP